MRAIDKNKIQLANMFNKYTELTQTKEKVTEELLTHKHKQITIQKELFFPEVDRYLIASVGELETTICEKALDILNKDLKILEDDLSYQCRDTVRQQLIEEGYIE